jgi:hypothetical protein
VVVAGRQERWQSGLMEVHAAGDAPGNRYLTLITLGHLISGLRWLRVSPLANERPPYFLRPEAGSAPVVGSTSSLRPILASGHPCS